MLYVKDDGCAYRFPYEFPDEAFRGSLETILEEDEARHFFVVEERDRQLHVLAYPRAHVAALLVGDAGGDDAPAPGPSPTGA